MLLNENDYKKLTDVIYRRTGIFINETKRFNILAPKISVHMQKKGYENFRAFFHEIRFNNSNHVLQEVIELFTINETYFFREKHQFETLVNDVLYELHKLRRDDEPMRILCSPSSTGEEPYSIALHLLAEAKLVSKRDFEIIGIDIDSNVIKKAKKGLYSKRSVEFLPADLKAQYFTQTGINWQIADFLTDVVDFKIVNVMDKSQMRSLGKFDVIFSRNMLIYFDDTSRKEVAMTFHGMLKPSGFVFLGHAESMNRIVSVFKPKKYENSIVYQK